MRQLRNVAGNLGEAVVREVQTLKRVHPVAGCPDGEVTQLVVAGIHLDLRVTREGAEHHSKTNKLLINYEPHPPTQRHSSTLLNTRTVCTPILMTVFMRQSCPIFMVPLDLHRP